MLLDLEFKQEQKREYARMPQKKGPITKKQLIQLCSNIGTIH